MLKVWSEDFYLYGKTDSGMVQVGSGVVHRPLSQNSCLQGLPTLWGIVGLVRKYPARCVNVACAQALQAGVYSYKLVLALTERLSSRRRSRPSMPRLRIPRHGGHDSTLMADSVPA
jgi:hypothetical protein